MTEPVANGPSTTFDLPPAVESPIKLGNENEPIGLYHGAAIITQGGKSCTANTDICLAWSPLPQIRFRVAIVPSGSIPEFGEIALRLEDGTEIPRCSIASISNACGIPGHETAIEGEVNQEVMRSPCTPSARMVFLIGNFEDMRGRAIAYTERSAQAARLSLSGDGWKITMDKVRNLSEVISRLRASSGFAVTHVGRLEREDGNPFSTEEGAILLRELGWYISFCCGRWAGPCLAWGSDDKNRITSQIWSPFRTAPYRERSSWMDRHHTEHFEEPFPGYMKLVRTNGWDDIVHVAIHWYVEANALAGSVEGAIVLTQTAFELLSAALLVEDHRWITDSCANSATFLSIKGWNILPLTEPPENGEGSGPLNFMSRVGWKSILPQHLVSIRVQSVGGCR